MFTTTDKETITGISHEARTSAMVVWHLPRHFARAKPNDADLLTELQTFSAFLVPEIMDVCDISMLAVEVVRWLQVRPVS